MGVINCTQRGDWGTSSFGSRLIWITWSLLCSDKNWLHFKKARRGLAGAAADCIKYNNFTVAFSPPPICFIVSICCLSPCVLNCKLSGTVLLWYMYSVYMGVWLGPLAATKILINRSKNAWFLFLSKWQLNRRKSSVKLTGKTAAGYICSILVLN